MTIFDKLKESTPVQAAEFMVQMVKLCETAADVLKEPVTKLLQETLESEVEE